MLDRSPGPNLSRRVAEITGGSDGWEVFLRSRQMIEDGVSVIELTIGEHDVRTDPKILNAMSAAARGGHTGYAAIPGTSSLRDAVAARVSERTGVKTGRDNVLITPGGQAALFAAHMVACEPGDKALYIDPYYATYPGTIRAASADPVAICTQADDGFRPSQDDVSRVASGAASILINSPNNPTGQIYGRETLEDIAAAAKEHNLWLISDEVYDSQVWTGAHISPRTLNGMANRTLVVGSLSKSHAMTGSRIGWLVGPEDAIASLIDLATTTTYGVPGFIQDASVFALEQGAGLEAQIAAPFARRRLIALETLANQPGVRVLDPQAAMYIMLDIRATGLTGIEFANRLLDERKIAVMPGESFGRSAAGHLRVALTVDDARLKQALQEIAEFARGLT